MGPANPFAALAHLCVRFSYFVLLPSFVCRAFETLVLHKLPAASQPTLQPALL